MIMRAYQTHHRVLHATTRGFGVKLAHEQFSDLSQTSRPETDAKTDPMLLGDLGKHRKENKVHQVCWEGLVSSREPRHVLAVSMVVKVFWGFRT